LEVAGHVNPHANMTDNQINGFVIEAALRGARLRGVQPQVEKQVRADGAYDPALSDYALLDTWHWMLEKSDIVDDKRTMARYRADAETGKREAIDIVENVALGWRALRSAFGRPLPDLRADSLRADAANFFPDALLSQWGGLPTRAPIVPTDLQNAIPTKSFPAWTEQYRVDYINRTGTIRWGQGSDLGGDMGNADYNVDFEVRPVMTLWTSYSVAWYQTAIVGSAPMVTISPVTEKSAAAMEAYKLAIESMVLRGVSGLDIWGLLQVPGLVRTSTLVYGSDPVQDCIKDLRKAAQYAKERSKGTFNVDTVDISPRILWRLEAEVVTSTGYPFDAAALVRRSLAEYGITTVNLITSLQDFGGAGSNMDAAVFRSSGEGGLRRCTVMPFTPVRTLQQGLNDVTFMVGREGGLYNQYAGSTFIYVIEVTPTES